MTNSATQDFKAVRVEEQAAALTSMIFSAAVAAVSVLIWEIFLSNFSAAAGDAPDNKGKAQHAAQICVMIYQSVLKTRLLVKK